MARKAFGLSYIPQRFAGLTNTFCRGHLNPCLNLRRYSPLPREMIDAKGKVPKTYPPDQVQKQPEKLVSLPGIDAKPCPGIPLERLHHQDLSMTDLQAA